MKRLRAWVGENFILISIVLYAGLLVIIFGAISRTQINDTLLGVIIALLFPIFATFVNHLLEQNLEQRQWRRTEAEKEKALLQQQKAELQLVYQKAIQHVGYGLNLGVGHEASLSALHEALATLLIYLPAATDADETPPAFAKAVKDFNLAYSSFMRGEISDFSYKILDVIATNLHLLIKHDPRIR